MTSPSNNAMPGRFIVKHARMTHRNLTAHAVVDLLAAEPVEPFEIFRIHRVYDDGRMDLVGVSALSLHENDGIVFKWDNVRSARQDFDQLVTLAERRPPPCRIQLRLVHASAGVGVHAVVLVFPAACGEGVGQWLSAAGFETSADVDASPGHLRRFEAGISQTILSAMMEPSPDAE